MRWQPILAIFLILALVAPAFAQLSENFTLNFPQGNGTTTYVTFQSVQDTNLQNLVGGGIVAFIALLLLIFLYRRYHQ